MHGYNQPSQPPTRKRRRRRSLLLSFLGFGFGALVVGFLAVSAAAGFLLWKVSKDLPGYESLAKYEPPVMTRIHAQDGALISEYARERRIFVPINTIPKRVIAAFLSARDEYIGQPDEIKRLFMSNATSLGRHEFFQGAGLIDLMRVLSNV